MSARTLIAAAFGFAISAGPASASYTALYAFGDSLSDVGNLYTATYLLSGGTAAEPAPPYSNGRFSNGDVWVQDLSAKLGLGPVTPSLLGGNDYAWGGATTGAPNTLNSQVPSLANQVSTFLNGGSASSTAVYTFSIGANDLFSILSNPALTPAAATADTIAAATSEAQSAGTLAAAGAKNLVVFDVPNLGLTPGIQEESASLGIPGLITAATNLSYLYDQTLFSLLGQYAPGLTVYDVNSFGLINAAVANPSKFGFSDVTDPCWTGTYKGTGGTLCSTTQAGQNQYLFWDMVHPTAAGHTLIADAAYTELTGSPAPEASTWAMMLFGFGGLGFAALRRPRHA